MRKPGNDLNGKTFSERDLIRFCEELEPQIEGQVRMDAGARALYSTDSSNYKQIPLGVVLPRTEADVVATVNLCRKHKLPITSRGGGTSLAGQTTNAAVIIDYSKYYNQTVSIDKKNKRVTVQPGIVFDDLQEELLPYGLQFGPDPSTHESCTLGGMIGNNACGVHSVLSEFKGGGARTSDNIHSLKIMTIEGEIMTVGETSDEEIKEVVKAGGVKGRIFQDLLDLREAYGDKVRSRFPKIPRRVSGYNLDDLLPENNFNIARALAGSEGTCAVILEATLNLVPKSKRSALAVIGFPHIYAAGDFVAEVRKYEPEALEGMDDILIQLMKKRGIHTDFLRELPRGKGWLMAEFGGETSEEAGRKARALKEALDDRPQVLDIRVYKDKEKQDHVWEVRESGLGATAHMPLEKDAWEGWEDSAVPPEKLGDYLREFRKLLNKYEYGCTLYGHFGHGIVHTRIDFGLKSKDGIEKFRNFLQEAARLVVRFGGSLSGEHGDGQARGELLEIMYGKELVRAFTAFKKIWDPLNLLNPGKVADPYRVDENLRYGSTYNPPELKTQFQFPEDNHSFPYAIERCVGVGKCRKTDSGTMCPSYMVTREEQHSTRGRARLLFEMIQGDVIGKNGWKDDNVAEALQLCLACKACKSECPVNVDMASYKAEFRYHYYKNRLRPASAYSMGYIDKWARLASLAPRVANFFSQYAPFSDMVKRIGGIAPQRDMPAFARHTFKQWHFNRKNKKRTGKRVILWPDTFNNHFFPQTAKAAELVLEAAGFEPVIPYKNLCCGRPLYDFGMLKTARRYLQRIMKTLAKEIEADVPVVGLEPSCISVFRDELINLFPTVESAKRLASNSMMLSEFLTKYAPDFELPELGEKAMVHGHCHHKSTMNMNNEYRMLDKMKLDYEILDSGCCGMAGSFGFEEENYDVSVACGERVLAPRIREADERTLLIAEGFSCREQIESLTNRKAMHPAEVMQMALSRRKKAPVVESVHV